MKNVLFIVLALLIVGCSKNPVAPVQIGPSSTIYSYAHDQYRVNFKDWPLVFDSVDNEMIIISSGGCIRYLYHIDIDLTSLLDSGSVFVPPTTILNSPSQDSLISDSISEIIKTVISEFPYDADIFFPPVFDNGHVYVQCRTDVVIPYTDISRTVIDSSALAVAADSDKNHLRSDLNSSWMTFRVNHPTQK